MLVLDFANGSWLMSTVHMATIFGIELWIISRCFKYWSWDSPPPPVITRIFSLGPDFMSNDSCYSILSKSEIPKAWNTKSSKRLQMLILRFSAAARHGKNFLPGARLQTHPWATLLDFLEIRWSAIVLQECVWIHIHHSLNTDDTSFSCNLYFTMMKLIFWYLT